MKHAMRLFRTHPVVFAALVGAVVGFVNAFIIEIPALFGRPSNGALSLLQSASRLGAVHAGSSVLQTAFILLIEVAANVLVFAVIFSVLGGLFLIVRKCFHSTRRRQQS